MSTEARTAWISASPTKRSLIVIARREIYDQMRNPLVWVLALFSMMLAGFSTRVGLEELRIERSIQAGLLTQREQDRARAAGQTSGWQIEPGLRAVRVPAAVRSIVAGSDLDLPQFWDFGPAGVRPGQPYLAGSSQSAIDLEFIIRIVLGLLAMVLAVESVAGERANGTLHALLGQSVQPGTVLAGKLVGSAATLAASIALVTGVLFLVAAATDRSVMSGGFTASMLVLAGSGWLYLFTVFTAGVLISILVQSYASALTAAVIVWLALGATGIGMAQVIARSLSPVPPAYAVNEQSERILEARTRDVQLRMGDRFLESLPPGTDWTRIDREPQAQAAALAQLQPVWDSHMRALRGELERLTVSHAAAASRQWRIAQALALLSPGAQFTLAATNLVGTGPANTRRWEGATLAYQSALNAALFDNPARLTILVPSESRRGPGVDGRWIVALTRQKATPFGRLPAFAAPAPTSWTRLRDAAPSLAVLGVSVLGLLTAAALAFQRTRV